MRREVPRGAAGARRFAERVRVFPAPALLAPALALLLGACAAGDVRPPTPPYPVVPVPPGADSSLQLDLRWQGVEVEFEDERVLDARAVLSQPSARLFLPADEAAPPPDAPGPGGPPADDRVYRVGMVPERLRELLAIDVERVAVRAGELMLVDLARSARPVIWLHRMELALENAATRARLLEGLPTLLAVRAQLGHTGLLTAFVTADPFGRGLEFAGRASIQGLDIREVSPLVASATGLRTPEGRLDVFVVFESRRGRVRGAVKLVVRGLDVDPARPGFLGWLKAKTVDVVGDLLDRDRERGDVLATVIPVEGELTDPGIQLWPTVFGILYNAFVGGFAASYAGLPPERAPAPTGPLAQGWRVLIQHERPRAQPVAATVPPRLEPDRGDVPVGWSPSALMSSGARGRLVQRLRERGLLPTEAGEGEVALAEALRGLQREKGLPETGIAGYATVEALGLDSAQIFRRSRPEQRGAAAR